MKGLNELIVAGWILFGLLLTPIIFGVMDFKSGVHKAKLRGERITSDGWRRSVKKVGEYYRLLFALVIVDCMHIGCSWYLNSFYDYHIPTFPFITFVGAMVVAAIEIRSIREKAEDKVKKQMSDVASLAVEISRHKAEPAEIAQAIMEYMNKEKEVKNESTN
ncbi:hypothetical protein [Bacteroides sp.]|uniref:hypothetical protein n=1 Tax=Bacteroides sp. TaxID=29523 RepID=UPI00261DDC64|nr:hypothetical protein [Bacteroides sp.]MDD3041261.1 hypothetical protein [Bacteroides sp.]